MTSIQENYISFKKYAFVCVLFFTHKIGHFARQGSLNEEIYDFKIQLNYFGSKTEVINLLYLADP